jgi:hypothetical protein
VQTKDFAQPTADAVALDGIADFACGHNPNAGGLGVSAAPSTKHDVTPVEGLTALAHSEEIRPSRKTG